MKSLNLTRTPGTSASGAGGGVARVNISDATVHQLKDQNAVLVNLCLELGNELFAMKYKREELTLRLQQQQQVDAVNHRTIEVGAVSVGTSSTSSGGGGGGISSGSGGSVGGQPQMK